MKQSRLASFIEQCLNTLSGFLLSLAAQAWFLPKIGVSISLEQNLTFACFMTLVSVARGYGWRRLMEALHIRTPLSPAMLAIIAERRRQKEAEGWTEEHDDAHAHGDLARAGAAYLYAASITNLRARRWLRGEHSDAFRTIQQLWPWAWNWWKPDRDGDVRHDLVRGGALALAELEKYDRSRKRKSELVIHSEYSEAAEDLRAAPSGNTAHGVAP